MKNAIDTIKTAGSAGTFLARRGRGVYLADVARVAALTGIVLFCMLCAGLASEPPQAYAASASSLSSAKVSLTHSSYTYTGGTINPLPTVKYGKKTLKKGTDYTVSYGGGRKNVGKYKVTVKGKGAYKGSKTVEFKITAASIGSASASVPGTLTYSGVVQNPVPSASFKSVTLKGGTDYSVRYDTANINAGDHKLTLLGKGNFSGSKTVEFKINPAPMSSVTACRADNTALIYTGSAHTPAVRASFRNMPLSGGTDYTVSYSNNVDAGDGRAILTGRGNYAGSTTVGFKISPAGISTASSTLMLGINGIAPVVTWGGRDLVLNRDFTVSYSLQGNGARLAASIAGRGNFTGSTSAEVVLVR